MKKTILITGSTDGIWLVTAKMLVSQGHNILLHGRSLEKLEKVEKALPETVGGSTIECYVAYLSQIEDVEALAKAVSEKHKKFDVLINNAGVYKVPNSITQDGLDVRFVVNTIAPYLLTKRLVPMLGSLGRVVNLSSAAQSPVDLKALSGKVSLSDGAAYAQSKLALTMWSHSMGLSLKGEGPVVVAVNPGSMLGSKMVKDAFGVEGADITIGAEILTRASLSDEFSSASGQYFDNDSGKFASPHPDALDPLKSEKVVHAIEGILDETPRVNYP